MIFRFADTKALTFAYADLLDAGIPQTAISACFEEIVAPQPDADHQSFLQHLHRWVQSEKTRLAGEGTPQEKPELPISPVFRKNGGTLEIRAKERAAEVIAVALHHQGEMVG